MNTKEEIFVHTTAADFTKIPEQFFAVNRWHKDRWGYYYNEKTKEQVLPSSLGYYGGYTILIEPDGTERRYREDDEETVAVYGHNNKSLSVVMAFDGDIQMPTEAQIDTLTRRLKKWQDKYNIPTEKIRHHREVNPEKTCPGILIPDGWARNLVSRDTTTKDNIEIAQKKILTDQLRALVLQLKILVKRYAVLLRSRNLG